MNKLGQKPAFSRPATLYSKDGVFSKEQDGISKRLYIACKAMQGILSGPTGNLPKLGFDIDYEDVSRMSFAMADALLKQEKK